MPRKKTLLKFFLAVLFLILSAYLYKTPEVKKQKNPSPTAAIKVQTSSAKVVRVIDGDTIEIEGGQKIRYIGIDTPELHHPSKKVQCFAKEAYEENKNLVEGRIITLEKDVSDTDRYGRLLRYVYLPPDVGETTHSGLLVNDYLVRRGFAVIATFPPDVARQDEFVRAQHEARENQRGLWSFCR